MIAAVPSPRVAAAAPVALPRRANASAASFADVLPSPEPDESEVATNRQDATDDGKAVPDKDADDETTPSPLAWLATLMPPVPQAPAPAAAPVPQTPAGSDLATAPAPEMPVAVPVEAQAPVLAAAAPATGAGLLALARDPALAGVHGPVEIDVGTAGVAKSAGSAPPSSPVLGTTMPAVTPGASAPAGQIFAAALHAASSKEERAEHGLTTADAAATPAIQIGADLAPHAVTGAGESAGGGMLDLSDKRWPQAMMDRIEQMRDDANAADTRIRVVPDRLGAIDVAVRRDGDTLHVRFHAAEAETRSLLADAQPRLAEIAQSRGLRLGDTAVGDGSGGGGRQDGRPAPLLAVRPAPSPATPAALAAEAPSDIRIG